MNASRTLRHHLGGIAILLIAAPLLNAQGREPGTRLIDDDGGPGIDHTDLQQAIDSANPGDLLLVMPGDYGCITIDKGLTIVGQGDGFSDVRIGGTFPCGTNLIWNVPSRQVVRIANVDFFWDDLRVQNNQGTVILDTVRGLDEVTASADFRAMGVVARSVSILQSTIELIECDITGEPGESVSCGGPGGDGGLALSLVETVGVLSQCRIQGGQGGTVACQDFPAGHGGDGLEIQGGDVRITGTRSVISGGFDGDDVLSHGGNAVTVLSGLLRWSGATLGGGPAGDQDVVELGGDVDEPAMIDPSLTYTGDAVPGGVLTLHIEGPPGANVALVAGRRPVVFPIPGWVGTLQVWRDQLEVVGTLPVSGELDIPHAIPAGIARGASWQIQAFIAVPPPDWRRTTASVPVIVR